MSKVSKKSREKKYYKVVGDHHKFISRITKTLYYGKLGSADRLSLPVTELASELFSEAHSGRSLDRLHCNDAAAISRNACVSPCSLVLAMLYIDRLKSCNPEYLQRTAPSELFLVSLMISSKFLHDDGEEDEVFTDEWAASGKISVKELIQLEKDFLKAIDWEVFVNKLTFWKKFEELELIVAKKEGLNRGWFTYTELQSLLNSVELYNLVSCIALFTAILAATYVVGVFIIAGSMLVVSQVPGNALQPAKTAEIILPNATIAADCKSCCKEEKTEIACKAKQLNAADVLKTGIILASIKARPCCNESAIQEGNFESASWDWWTSPTMEWLTRTSKFIEDLGLAPRYKFSYSFGFMDVSFASLKAFALEDQIHKATKVRLQDQMESSWHKEWTDTIRQGFLKKDAYTGYIQNVK